MISIIIPAKNEKKTICDTLSNLQILRKKKVCEIILVDGRSDDETINISKPYVDKILSISPNRSRQQNLGASIAEGEMLLFLHADTHISSKVLLKFYENHKNYKWGFFSIKLNHDSIKYRILEFLINLRSRIFKYGTGDQCLFINKKLFTKINGFPVLELMEDISICSILKKEFNPSIIKSVVKTSARRWESHGFLITVIKMRLLRLLYIMGFNTSLLRKLY
ncbi:MAG: TIGR04283 family arsenosugar biosynthesis glycosyltransferase [Pelagibacterales bacterium]|nr:TIGR04283 family arsenosugar biosynthesis glycosyltransferase [Pelagibacterales bacterium]